MLAKTIFYIFLVCIVLASVAMYISKWKNRHAGTSKYVDGAKHNSKGTKDGIDYSSGPDEPMPFGYKSQWIAIHASDSNKVLANPIFKTVKPSNWKYGINRAYQFDHNELFITPPISGWILIVGNSIPDISDEKWKVFMNSFNDHFDEVQYFGTHRVVEYQAWVKFVCGNIQRGFAYIGDQGTVIMDTGKKDDCERNMNIYIPPDDSPDSKWDKAIFPNEENVMMMAGEWSVNPVAIEEMKLPKSSGYIATFEI